MKKQFSLLLDLIWWLFLLTLDIKAIFSAKNEWVLSLAITLAILSVIQIYLISKKINVSEKQN